VSENQSEGSQQQQWIEERPAYAEVRAAVLEQYIAPDQLADQVTVTPEVGKHETGIELRTPYRNERSQYSGSHGRMD
jgi:hypothetical protein